MRASSRYQEPVPRVTLPAAYAVLPPASNPSLKPLCIVAVVQEIVSTNKTHPSASSFAHTPTYFDLFISGALSFGEWSAGANAPESLRKLANSYEPWNADRTIQIARSTCRYTGLGGWPAIQPLGLLTSGSDCRVTRFPKPENRMVLDEIVRRPWLRLSLASLKQQFISPCGMVRTNSHLGYLIFCIRFESS